jgi:CxxC motif-containing protein
MALGALIALTVAGIATAEKPVKVRAGNLDLTFNGGFTPKTLSKTKLTPISLNVSADIKTVDGTHPPALKEFNVETDKNGAINVKGLPVCTASKLQSQDTKHAEAICKTAIIGSGQATAEIQFPEQAPIPAKSKIIAFNGGFKGGVTTLFVHAYLTVPTPAAIVTTVKVKKISNGRYGLEAKSSIPKIAGGSGSVTHFNLAINKKGVLSAKCPDGKLQAHGTAVFTDGTRASAEVIRTCTGK